MAMPRGREAFRLCIDDCLKLDMAEPSTRSALAPGIIRSGSWTWSRHGDPIGSISYFWNGVRRELRLNYSVARDPVTQHILLAATKPRFGGERWWFVCQRTGKMARVLYLAPGGRHFLSREAYRLVYASTRESGSAARLFRMLMRYEAFGANPDKLLLQIGDISDPFGVREERQAIAAARRNSIRRLRRKEQISLKMRSL